MLMSNRFFHVNGLASLQTGGSDNMLKFAVKVFI